MLFPYRHVPHRMEKMQEFIDFIFHKVWCEAPASNYSIDLFAANSDLYAIMDSLYREDLAGTLKGSGKFFYEGVNEIYSEFKKLTASDIGKYISYFTANNNIAHCCAGHNDCIPVTYALLDPSKADLNQKLEDFFKNLYSSGFLDLAKTADKVGSLSDYYKIFVRINNEGVCPFCGILPIDGEFDPTREAFDHFLPKSKYPFNSINLRNLSPSCYKCNSGNKRDKDPLYDGGGNRRKAFYPFDSGYSGVEVSISIIHKNWCDLTDADIAVEFGPMEKSEEINTWKELFRIDQRYVSRCCYKNGGLGWLNRVFVECANYGMTPAEMLQAEIDTAGTSPWFEANFLKKAFLEGCERAGLFG